MKEITDLTGQKFGKLTVIGRVDNKGKNHYWDCLCECGNIKSITAGHFKFGKTSSCGCIKSEKTRLLKLTHDKRNHPLYSVWLGMRARCHNPKNIKFHDYGGRGIAVCRQWDNFQNFYDDMFPTWQPKLTLDRINNNGNYEPDNCKWSTQKEQARNRRSTHLIEFKGKTQCLTDWAVEYNIPRFVLSDRLNKYKWSIERALTNK